MSKIRLWKDGKKEYWRSKADDDLILFSAPCRQNKKQIFFHNLGKKAVINPATTHETQP